MYSFFHSHKHAHDFVGRQERYAKFRGTARADISHLKLDRGRQRLDHEQVETLEKAFSHQGCHRLEPVNRIVALISQQELATLLLCSDISQSTLLHGADTGDKPPKLTFPVNTTLRVLHGQHRLEAAKSHLPLDDAWWTIDLFLDDMSSVLVNSLREEYSNPKAYSDGEIVRQIRLSHQQGRIFQEMKWWACLTREKTQDLKRILENEELRECFDNLLDVTGLWDGFRIGTMRRYLTLRCHEVFKNFQQRLFRADRTQELSTYLRRIRYVWLKIASSNARLMNLVDAGTVKSLESRAPAASEHDANFVRTCMDTGKIFAQVLDPSVRKTIVNNICAVERLIPSFWTFFEDVKLLQPCSKAIQVLLELHDNDTIHGALSMIFVRSVRDQQRFIRQDGENHFVQSEAGEKDDFEFSYRQLWIYAIRHFPDLITVVSGKELAKGSSCVKEPDSILWYRFARLALRMGFRSRKIELMGSVSALNDAVVKCISWIASSTKNGVSPKHLVAEVRDRLQIETDAPPEGAPSLTTDDGNIDVQYRCGRLYEALRREAKSKLFIRWLYDVEEPRGRYITTSFIQRAVIHAFFGHEIRPRNKETGQQQVDDSGSENRVFLAESCTDLHPALAAGLARSAPTETTDTPEPSYYHMMEHDLSAEQESVNPNFATLADIRPSPALLSILSPRKEEDRSQNSLTEMIMTLPTPGGIGTFDPGECSGVPASYLVERTSSPSTMDQPGQDLVVRDSLSPEISSSVLSEIPKVASRLHCLRHTKSPISPMTPSEQCDQRLFVREECLDNTPMLDAERELLSVSASTVEAAASSAAFASTSFTRLERPIATGRASRPTAELERSSKSPEDETEDETLSGCDSDSERSDLILNYDIRAPNKRIGEIVAESQSCISDSTTYSSTVARHENRKRPYKVYSRDLQEIYIDPTESENGTAKRMRFSMA